VDVAVAEYPEEEMLEPEVPVVVELDSAEVAMAEEMELTDLNAPEIVEPVLGSDEPQVVELEDPELVVEAEEIVPVDEPEIVEPEIEKPEPEVVELAEADRDDEEEIEITELDEPEVIEAVITDGSVEVVLEEAEAKPPVNDGDNGKIERDDETIVEEEVLVEIVEAVVEETPFEEVPANLYLIEAPVVEQLTPGYHYIQVGVYGDESGASAAVSRLEREYPVLVWYPEQTLDHFKVMIGPLLPDESGTLLYLFQNSGFGDAFIRKL